MSTPMGETALKTMLAPSQRVLLSNTTGPDRYATITAAVVVRHYGDEAAVEILQELNLAAAQSRLAASPGRPGAAPTLIEVLLRVRTGRRVADIHLTAAVPADAPARGWEAGLREADGPGPGDVPLAETPGVAAFLSPYD